MSSLFSLSQCRKLWSQVWPMCTILMECFDMHHRMSQPDFHTSHVWEQLAESLAKHAPPACQLLRIKLGPCHSFTRGRTL